MGRVKIVGAAMTPFGKFPDETLSTMAVEAAFGALADAGVDAGEVGIVAFGNAAAGVVTGQEMIRAQTRSGPPRSPGRRWSTSRTLARRRRARSMSGGWGSPRAPTTSPSSWAPRR